MTGHHKLIVRLREGAHEKKSPCTTFNILRQGISQRGNAMRARFRSWWQYIRKHWVALGVVGIVLVVVIVLIIVGYRFDWTGFNGYTKVTTAHTTGGPNVGTVVRTEEDQPGKGLWDWLQLLFVPTVLTLGAVWITARHNHDREVAADNQRAAALQTYIDKMSDLLLRKRLHAPNAGDEVRKVARVQTLTVLSRLDSTRKRNIACFLQESGLIGKSDTIIDLGSANLREAELHQVNLSKANLHEVDLRGANLEGADLTGANLQGANLSKANLDGANLNNADLSEAVFIETDLRGADLTNAIATPEQFTLAKNVTPEQLAQIKRPKPAAPQEATTAQASTTPGPSEGKPDSTGQKEVEQQEHSQPKQGTDAVH